MEKPTAILGKYKRLRQDFIQYQESASYNAYNNVCIVLQNTPSLEEAHKWLHYHFENASTQDAKAIYSNALADLA